MRIIDAMYRRKSVRAYAATEIERDLLERIKQRLNQTELIYPSSGISWIVSEYCEKSRFAPYYIGVYTDESREGKINAGYALQQLSVYLAAIGIASCYQVKVPLLSPVNADGRKLTIALAFGYAKGRMYRKKEEADRLGRDKVCVVKEKPNEEMEKIIEAGMIAPSSYNVQPERFVVYSNRVHVFVKNKMFSKVGKLRYVNIGVVLGNMMLAADEYWIDINIREVAEIKDKNYGDNEYVISLYNKSDLGSVINLR